MERLKWPDDEAIQAKMVTRAIENAQKQIEELNYERRKNVLKYDEVMNTQRKVIYGERRKILEGRDLSERGARDGRGGRAGPRCGSYVPARRRTPRSGTSTRCCTSLGEVYPVHDARTADARGRPRRARAPGAVRRGRAGRLRREGRGGRHPTTMRELERMVLLNITDTKWREHLYEMDYLQEGIHLRAYAQKDPLTEYQREAFDMFEELKDSIRDDFVRYIYRVEFVRPGGAAGPTAARPGQPRGGRERRRRGGGPQAGTRTRSISDKMPRNAPCPCGSRQEVQEVPRRRRLTTAPGDGDVTEAGPMGRPPSCGEGGTSPALVADAAVDDDRLPRSSKLRGCVTVHGARSTGELVAHRERRGRRGALHALPGPAVAINETANNTARTSARIQPAVRPTPDFAPWMVPSSCVLIVPLLRSDRAVAVHERTVGFRRRRFGGAAHRMDVTFVTGLTGPAANG